jgi:hypothetical protein
LTFLAMIGWAFLRGAGKAGPELLVFAALATLSIPLTSLIAGIGWLPGGWTYRHTLIIDLTAAVGAFALIWMARIARRRAVTGGTDSVWTAAAPHRVEAVA